MGLFPSSGLALRAAQIEDFEAAGSVSNIGTGARREGSRFEELVGGFWYELRVFLEQEGAICEGVAETGSGSKRWCRISVGDRAIYLPSRVPFSADRLRAEEVPGRWLKTAFKTSDLVAAYPGTEEAIERYAPVAGDYAGDAYPQMFRRTKTNFDDTILLEDGGVLTEKILLEYKTAKSSKGLSLDGNAHERLSFQIMQYLEIATMYPKCSLYVMTNGAFARYRNKYHVNFRLQADRMSVFRWFFMRHVCTQEELAGIVRRFADWLNGKEK